MTTTMIHKYWCGKCRKLTEAKGEKPKEPPACHSCKGLTTFLESTQGPPDETKRTPPCLEEWVHAGYDESHYKLRFSTPDWGPTWSNPNWKPPPKEPEHEHEHEHE